MAISEPAQLEALARIRAERQLKSLRPRGAYDGGASACRGPAKFFWRKVMPASPLTIPEARAANAQAGRAARELRHADREMQQLQPRFEVACKVAATEFGRARSARWA